MGGVLVRRGEVTQTHQVEDRGSDWSTVSTSQGVRRAANYPRKLGERHGTDFPLKPSEGTIPTDTLILDLYPPEL